MKQVLLSSKNVNYNLTAYFLFMKRMRYKLHKPLLLICISFLFVACGDNLSNEIEEAPKDEDVLQMENSMNGKIANFHTLFSALQNKEHFSSIIDFSYNGQIAGYTIFFNSGAKAEIEFNPSGYSVSQPILGARQGDDGSFYWTFNDSWVKDDVNEKILVSSVKPIAQIIKGKWEISFDGGNTWKPTDKSKDVYIMENIISLTNNDNVVVLNMSTGNSYSLVQTDSHKICYLYDTEDLQGWSEGLLVEDGTWIIGKKVAEGYLTAMGNIESPTVGCIAYCDNLSRPYEIFIEDKIIRLCNYTNKTVDALIIGNGKVLDACTIDLPMTLSISTRSGELSNVAGLFSTSCSIIDIVLTLTNYKRLSLAIAQILLSKISGQISFLDLVCGGNLKIPHALTNALNAAGVILDGLAAFSIFGLGAGAVTALGIAGAVAGVISIYAHLWDEYWDLYNQQIEDIYGQCQANIIRDIKKEGNSVTVFVTVEGYEPFGIQYDCGVAIDDSIFAPDVKEDTQKSRVTENKDYQFTYRGLKYDHNYKARPFLENTDGYTLWRSFIGEMVGPLIRYGEEISFKLESPSATTGISIVENEHAATVYCTYSNISPQTECGVELSWEGNSKIVTANNQEGEQSIALGDLDPGTTYDYRAYVKYEEGTKYGAYESFATAPASIFGTWSVIETYISQAYPGAEWETRTREFFLTLYENGTLQISNADYNYVSGNWTYFSDGIVNITGHIISTQTQTTWDRFEGMVDDVKNPKKISGIKYRGNMNQVTSNENNVGSFVMAR